ncbi:phage major capsid protein, P2 family [Erwinia rhapontici]|uniref:phage major capsid protein, P2 family n=1 Tax=Erwinia rhapontici TaxID=55212 RepID=UPI00105E2F97|nr:phage major capsid protein, P2 family [Erwinia rhapontici]NKG32817.1 phage major capsid protein, P2 family [Erwinia rhapontici]TDS93421.1 P2 family phage major capsid protein [Erwinia rhapontici]
MKTTTRIEWDKYTTQQAKLNSIPVAHVGTHFSIAPSVAQTLENKTQQSSEFLKKINVYAVDEQEDEKIGLGISGPVASTNSGTTVRREPRPAHSLDSNKYRCEQTNFDTYITYKQLDQWSKFPDFQQRVSNQIILRRALDRIMIGFNGTTHAEKSDLAVNPLLQDVNIGWLQQFRTNAPQRVMKNITLTSRDEDNKIIAKGDYGNADSLVKDAVNNLLDEWYKDSTDLVVICGRDIIGGREHAVLNSLSQTNPNSETLAGQLLLSSNKIGGLSSYIAPYFPGGAMLVTSFKNLSLYYMEDKHRRMLKDEPEYNRVSTYESSNDAYVVEDYGFGCLIEGITFAEAAGE